MCCSFLVPFVLVIALPAQCVIRIMAGSLVDSDIFLAFDTLDAMDVGRYSSLTSQGDVFAKPLGANNPKHFQHLGWNLRCRF